MDVRLGKWDGNISFFWDNELFLIWFMITDIYFPHKFQYFDHWSVIHQNPNIKQIYIFTNFWKKLNLVEHLGEY